MYCPKCGTEVEDGAKFCPKCGNPMAQEQPAPAPEAAPAPSQPPAPAAGGRPNFVIPLAGGAAILVVFAVLVWIFLLAPYKIDEGTFPDAAVRSVVASQMDLDRNGELSRDEASQATEFTVDGAANLDGIRVFPNLKTVVVKGSSLSSADIGALGALETFEAPDSSLATLDISNNHNLTRLSVPDGTQVTGTEATPLKEMWYSDELTVSSKSSSDSELGKDFSYKVTRASDGSLEEMVQNYYNEYGSVSSTYDTVFEYDDAGRVDTSTTTSTYSSSSSDPSVTTYTYGYNDAGVLTTITQTGSSGMTESLSYDDAGKLTGLTRTYSSSTSEPYTTSVGYDDQGRATSIYSESSDYGTSTFATWSYDENGTLTGYATSYGDSYNLNDHALTYDEQGHVTGVKITPGQLINPDYSQYAPSSDDYSMDASYTYDENGVLTGGSGATHYSSGGDTTTATCEYDNAGRLVKVSKSQKSNYGDSTYLYDTVYELVYHRAFISKDDETDKNYLYCMPSYDEYLFTYGTKSPVSVRVPDLPPDFYTVEYTMSYTM